VSISRPLPGRDMVVGNFLMSIRCNFCPAHERLEVNPLAINAVIPLAWTLQSSASP
jgi:hypothetical protein